MPMNKLTNKVRFSAGVANNNAPRTQEKAPRTTHKKQRRRRLNQNPKGAQIEAEGPSFSLAHVR